MKKTIEILKTTFWVASVFVLAPYYIFEAAYDEAINADSEPQ